MCFVFSIEHKVNDNDQFLKDLKLYYDLALKSINLNLNTRFNFRLYLLGIFYNFLLPGGIGGDGYKIYLLKKRFKLPAKKVFWAIFFDRLSGLWAIGLIIVCLKIFIPQIEIHIAIPLGIFVLGSLVYYFVVKKFFSEFGAHFFKGHAKAIIVQSFQILSIISFVKIIN